MITIKNINVLNEVAFIHSGRLLRAGVHIDANCEVSLKYLNAIYAASPEDVFDALLDAFAKLKRNFGNITPNISTPAVYDYNLIWARMYVVGYFTMHDDHFWRKRVLPKMNEMCSSSMKEDINCTMKHIDQYYTEKEEWSKALIASGAPSPDDFEQDNEKQQLLKRIDELEQQLKEKEEELEQLKSHPRLSFIQTEGKSPQSISWAYQDIQNAVSTPADMAACLHDLQLKDMLKGQERIGKLKNLKKLYDSLKNTYRFSWTYPALCRAIKRLTNSK